MLSLIPKSANHSRPSKFQRTPPDVNSEWAGGAATLVASLLARLERLTKVPPFSLIALGRYPESKTRREALPIAEDKCNNTARLRPVQGISNRRDHDQLSLRLRLCETWSASL
jgi:hypothetical protein